MDVWSNWYEPGQDMYKRPGSNRVNFCYKEFKKLTLHSSDSQSQVPVFVYFERIANWRVNIKCSKRLIKYSKCTCKENKTTVRNCQHCWIAVSIFLNQTNSSRHIKAKSSHENERVYCIPIDRSLKIPFKEAFHDQPFPKNERFPKKIAAAF